MPITNALASLAVRDLAAATEWYEQLFGPGSRPIPEVVEWQLADGGGLQVYELPERAGRGSCTVVVSDIDEMVGVLRRTGIAPDAAAMRHDQVDTVMIKDPDGNSIAFATPKDAAPDR
jgi:catechol 2,3-dioxygenase-like lactoylglutathione lyase family enzyme